MSPIIEVERLCISISNRVVIRDATFRIDRPSLVVVIGPNGAGKTTLMKTLIGLLSPNSGKLKIFDVDVSRGRFPRKLRERIGYMPQRDAINYTVPITVKEILVSGILEKVSQPRLVIPTDMWDRVLKIADELKIGDILNKCFQELSGGQQQKVLLGRALAKDPDLLILDEPLSNVDEISKIEILEFMKRIVHERGKTVLLVTHDVEIAISWSDYVLLVNQGRALLYSSRMVEDIDRFLRHYPERDRKIIPTRSPYCA